MLTPNDIEVLIHCYVNPNPHPRSDAPAVQEALVRFLRDGLIYLSPDGYFKTTSAGDALIQRLRNVKDMIDPEKITAIEVHGDTIHYVMGAHTVEHKPESPVRFSYMQINSIDVLECQIKSALQNFEPGLSTVERVKRLHAKCTAHANRIISLEERVTEIVEVTSNHVIVKDAKGNRVHHPYVSTDNHAWATAQATIKGLRNELHIHEHEAVAKDSFIRMKDSTIADQTSKIKELEAKLAIMQDGYDKLLKEKTC